MQTTAVSTILGNVSKNHQHLCGEIGVPSPILTTTLRAVILSLQILTGLCRWVQFICGRPPTVNFSWYPVSLADPLYVTVSEPCKTW